MIAENINVTIIDMIKNWPEKRLRKACSTADYCFFSYRSTKFLSPTLFFNHKKIQNKTLKNLDYVTARKKDLKDKFDENSATGFY